MVRVNMLRGSLLAVALLLPACGGGGGGGAMPSAPGGGGGSQQQTSATGTFQVAVSTSPLTYGALGSAQVVFSCGCSAQAGTTSTDSSGNYTLSATSPATPTVPNPTYTLTGGRNYVVVGTDGTGTQAWTVQFVGNSPATDLSLGNSDATTAAAALYVFYYSTTGDLAFDNWNYNTIAAWASVLRSNPNAAEAKLIADVDAAQVAHTSLWPSAPSWNTSQSTNTTIAGDLGGVKAAADPALPTPCPSGCTGTPTP